MPLIFVYSIVKFIWPFFRFDLYALTPTGKEDEAGIKKAADKCMLKIKHVVCL